MHKRTIDTISYDVKLFLIHAICIINLFAFSFFNDVAASAFIEPDRVELVDSNDEVEVYSLRLNTLESNFHSSSVYFDFCPTSFGNTLISYNSILEVRYKSICTVNRSIVLYHLKPYRRFFIRSDETDSLSIA